MQRVRISFKTKPGIIEFSPKHDDDERFWAYIFYTQKVDYINFMICKKNPFISLSRCTNFYVKYKLRKCYVLKFYHNKAKKQAMEVLVCAVALTYHQFKELNYSYLQWPPQYKAGAIKA